MLATIVAMPEVNKISRAIINGVPHFKACEFIALKLPADMDYLSSTLSNLFNRKHPDRTYKALYSDPISYGWWVADTAMGTFMEHCYDSGTILRAIEMRERGEKVREHKATRETHKKAAQAAIIAAAGVVEEIAPELPLTPPATVTSGVKVKQPKALKTKNKVKKVKVTFVRKSFGAHLSIEAIAMIKLLSEADGCSQSSTIERLAHEDAARRVILRAA